MLYSSDVVITVSISCRPLNYGEPLEGETSRDYRTRRDKNNASSAASRRKKQEKMRALKDESVALERRNIELKVRVGRRELGSWHGAKTGIRV